METQVKITEPKSQEKIEKRKNAGDSKKTPTKCEVFLLTSLKNDHRQF